MSNNGIKTSFWGPHAWGFLFSIIAGVYPIKLNRANKDHMKIVKSVQSTLKALEHTLPCGYCRCSYKEYIRDLPLKDYEQSRMSMMRWLYLLHDKVNKKLMNQELESLQIEKEKLKAKRLTPTQMKKELQQIKSKIIKTKASPPFERVVAMYEAQRA